MKRPVSRYDALKRLGNPCRVDKAQDARPLVGIADKHRIACDGLVEIIIRDGRFNPVVAVATGGEFLKATERQPIAVGIIGWAFTDMTGGDVLIELKRRKSKIRIIIYSGEDGEKVLREAVTLGAWGFVSKRSEPTYLLDIIAAVASGRPSLPNLDFRTFANNPLVSLTDRERDLLSSLANGWSNQEIAERLGISRNTVKYHLKNLYDKLDVNNRTMAIALLRRDGKR
jgi:two-component system nitrate/nitrite response regulator NarP